MKEKIIIRAMKESDLDHAIELWNHSFQAGYSQTFDTKKRLINYLKRNPGFSTVAYVSNEMIGALLCGHDGRRASVYNTAVKPEYRKLGIGRKMEKRAISEFKKVGITTGFLFINVKNPGSKDFWESIGWTVIDDIKYLYKQF